MRLNQHSILAATTLLTLSLFTTAFSHAQQTPQQSNSTKGAIIGTGAFTSFVENMDRSLAFYHDVFGMEVPPLPASGARNYNRENPQLYAMFDIPGARERHESANVPGTNVRVEIMEVQDVPVKTLALRMQDPGAVMLVFIVRNVDALLARAKAAKVDVVTPGGLPVPLADGSRSVIIKDLDSRSIELRQPTQFAADAAANDIVDMRLSIAVADLAQTTQVYRDVLGFSVEAETTLSADPQLRVLTGLATADVQRNRIQAPGSKLWIELVEYQNVERQTLPMRIQDRGAARLQLRAENIDEMVSAMKQARLHVVSEGGVAVPIPPNFKGALVADPNNFFLTLFAPCTDCGAAFPAGSEQ
jgi:catechol 2,3-dioxygenase-like lactoylglutathione lyase family enzyme